MTHTYKITGMTCASCKTNVKDVLIDGRKIRKEAIKWVKEDNELIAGNALLHIERLIAKKFVQRWMKRLDITEGDLLKKEEHPWGDLE